MLGRADASIALLSLNRRLYPLVIPEVPLRVVGREIVRSKGGSAVSCRIKYITRVQALLAGDGLRHDAEGAIDKLLDAPQLFVGTREGGNCSNLKC